MCISTYLTLWLKLGQVWTYEQLLQPLSKQFELVSFQYFVKIWFDLMDYDCACYNSVLCSYLCLMEQCASSVLQSAISGKGTVFKSRGMCFVVPANEVALTCASCCALDVQYWVTLATWFWWKCAFDESVHLILWMLDMNQSFISEMRSLFFSLPYGSQERPYYYFFFF